MYVILIKVKKQKQKNFVTQFTSVCLKTLGIRHGNDFIYTGNVCLTFKLLGWIPVFTFTTLEIFCKQNTIIGVSSGSV